MGKWTRGLVLFKVTKRFSRHFFGSKDTTYNKEEWKDFYSFVTYRHVPPCTASASIGHVLRMLDDNDKKTLQSLKTQIEWKL